MSNYSDFAFYYDGLTKNVSYRSRAEYFDKLIKESCKSGGNYLVDLACGTGSLSEEFARLGYDVTGIDNSTGMLSEAMNKKYDSQLDIQYVCQDMTSFELYGNADVVICALDSINHLETPEDIKKTFERVHVFTEPGGVFIFDINTVYKHREILGNNSFILENDQVFCAWQNSYEEQYDRVNISLDFFEKTENGSYTRYSEDFSEIALQTGEIEKYLAEAGFEIIHRYDEDSTSPVHEKSQRIIYVCTPVN